MTDTFGVREKQILKSKLETIPKVWDGKTSILELRENNFQWRQTEWIGFWFEYWCKKNLSEIMNIPYKKKYGNVIFDGFWKFPWDLKTHAINKSRYVIVNACSAIEQAISEFGYFGLIIVKGKATYDNSQCDFYNWHQELKGEKSKYVLERESRNSFSRLRKTSFHLTEIIIRIIGRDGASRFKTFQNDFRNSNGSLRKKKFLIDPNTIDSEETVRLEF